MATVAQGVMPLVRVEGRWFYVSMAVICAVVAFAGFLPTYWLPLVAGMLDVPPVRHLHAALFFAWCLFFVAQTALVAGGRTRRHRQLGRIGAALAAVMVISGVMVAANSLHLGIANGSPEAAKAFLIVPLTTTALFASLVTIAIANVRRPAVHKRLMLVASVAILEAPVARPFMLALAPAAMLGPPPVMVTLLPVLAIDLLIVAGLVYDWRHRGRPHAAYVYGGLATLAVQLLRIPASDTPAWLAIAGWFAAVTG